MLFLCLLLVKDKKINELTWVKKLSETLPYTPISNFVNFPGIQDLLLQLFLHKTFIPPVLPAGCITFL